MKIEGKNVDLIVKSNSELDQKTSESFLPLFLEGHFNLKKEFAFLIAIHMANKFANQFGVEYFNMLDSEDKDKWYDTLDGYYPLTSRDLNALIF